MEINLGSVKMPINAATKSFAILAKRGAGKTYLGGVMAEEFFKNGIPFVVFDPIDGNKAWVAFWGSGVYECSNAASACRGRCRLWSDRQAKRAATVLPAPALPRGS